QEQLALYQQKNAQLHLIVHEEEEIKPKIIKLKKELAAVKTFIRKEMESKDKSMMQSYEAKEAHISHELEKLTEQLAILENQRKALAEELEEIKSKLN
ncbi:hypothetical protein D6777_01250, partial [Candidatus Woesearchaeota archaeon]